MLVELIGKTINYEKNNGSSTDPLTFTAPRSACIEGPASSVKDGWKAVKKRTVSQTLIGSTASPTPDWDTNGMDKKAPRILTSQRRLASPMAKTLRRENEKMATRIRNRE